MYIVKWFVLIIVCFALNSGIHASAANVITEIPTNGIVIDSPGTYVFGKNIAWNPTADGPAILILSAGVTLDMQNFTLKSTNQSFNSVGIQAALSSNLIIKNGTVANMTLGGVKCEGCAFILINNITIDGLHLVNTATYTVPVGILVDTSAGICVSNCTVKNMDVTTGSMAAIQMTAVISSEILNCLVTNLLNRDGACTGIGHLLCDTATVKSCTINNLESQFIDNLNTEGHTAIGLIPFISSNLLLENCTISNVTGCCDDAHGISVFECANAVVKNCTVNNVVDGAGPAQTGAKATGIEVYASGVQVIKCSVKNITAINPQDKQATGFSCAQCNGVQFLDCYAENVRVVDENGLHDASLGYGTGFGWAPDPRIIVPAVNILIKNCTAKRCQLGFDSWYFIDSVWDNIKSICNEIPILNLGNYQRTLSCDPCSECGCLFTGCYPAPFTIILDNIAANNTFVNVKIKNCSN